MSHNKSHTKRGFTMAPIVYEAAVYSQEVSYKNFKGEDRTTTLMFALDPYALMAIFATIPNRKIKSGNPALNGKDADFTDEQQIKLVRDLASKAAGVPSEDGEAWLPFEDFENNIAGKVFMTKLATSDQIRRDFSEKVLLEPFRAFVSYSEQDASNSPKEITELKDMLSKLEKMLKTPDPTNETVEDRKARLQAQLKELDAPSTSNGSE